MTTAIIKRPNTYPPPHVLECDGPIGHPIVNRTPGTHLGLFLSFEEWQALPPHHKFTELDPYTIDYKSACRIARIIDNAERADGLPIKHLKELRWRMEVLVPGCTSPFNSCTDKYPTGKVGA